MLKFLIFECIFGIIKQNVLENRGSLLFLVLQALYFMQKFTYITLRKEDAKNANDF